MSQRSFIYYWFVFLILFIVSLFAYNFSSYLGADIINYTINTSSGSEIPLVVRTVYPLLTRTEDGHTYKESLIPRNDISTSIKFYQKFSPGYFIKSGTLFDLSLISLNSDKTIGTGFNKIVFTIIPSPGSTSNSNGWNIDIGGRVLSNGSLEISGDDLDTIFKDIKITASTNIIASGNTESIFNIDLFRNSFQTEASLRFEINGISIPNQSGGFDRTQSFDSFYIKFRSPEFLDPSISLITKNDSANYDIRSISFPNLNLSDSIDGDNPQKLLDLVNMLLEPQTDNDSIKYTASSTGIWYSYSVNLSKLKEYLDVHNKSITDLISTDIFASDTILNTDIFRFSRLTPSGVYPFSFDNMNVKSQMLQLTQSESQYPNDYILYRIDVYNEGDSIPSTLLQSSIQPTQDVWEAFMNLYINHTGVNYVPREYAYGLYIPDMSKNFETIAFCKNIPQSSVSTILSNQLMKYNWVNTSKVSWSISKSDHIGSSFNMIDAFLNDSLSSFSFGTGEITPEILTDFIDSILDFLKNSLNDFFDAGYSTWTYTYMGSGNNLVPQNVELPGEGEYFVTVNNAGSIFENILDDIKSLLSSPGDDLKQELMDSIFDTIKDGIGFKSFKIDYVEECDSARPGFYKAQILPIVPSNLKSGQSGNAKVSIISDSQTDLPDDSTKSVAASGSEIVIELSMNDPSINVDKYISDIVVSNSYSAWTMAGKPSCFSTSANSCTLTFSRSSSQTIRYIPGQEILSFEVTPKSSYEDSSSMKFKIKSMKFPLTTGEIIQY